MNSADGLTATAFAAALGIAATPASTTDDPLEELLMTNAAYPSWSIYATPGEPDVPIVNQVRALDAKGHKNDVDDAAREGDLDAIRRIARTAAGQGTAIGRTPYAIGHAIKVLNEINAAHPEWIIAAIPGKA